MNLLLLFLVVDSALAFVASSIGAAKDYAPNSFKQIYNDIKGDAYEVGSLKELDPKDLRKYGIVRVRDSNSVLVSNSLANLVMNPLLTPKGDSLEGNLNYVNDFVEVSFAEMEFSKSTSNWEPIGECFKNSRSKGKTTVTRGWSISIGSGISNALSFSSSYSLAPSFSIDLTSTYGISGSISCSVSQGKTVQFLVKSEMYEFSGVKMRNIRIKDKFNTFGQLTQSEFDYDDDSWTILDDYELPNSRKYHTACVTNPMYQTCNEADSFHHRN